MDIVYAASDRVGSALFVEREGAKNLARLWRAITTATTWGEFRRQLTTAEWDNLAERVDETPSDDTEFSPSDLPGYDDGDYPLFWPQDAAVKWFPKDLIDKYGGEIATTPNGYNLELPVNRADEIAEDLRTRGHTVEKSTDDLPQFINMVYA